MGAKIQMLTIVASFLLYLADFASDAYVAFRHYENGDRRFFVITCILISQSILICNIYATSVLDAPWYIRALAFLSSFSMICLFIREIRRCKEENFGSKAHPCYSGKHFSECDCGECTEQLKKSAKASLKMSHVRSMETFVEAIPQWLLQVWVMVDKQSYPWYTMVSVVISFISLVFGVYSLEKNYWIRKIVEDNDHVKPVSFPTRASVFFILWQALLVLARLTAIVLTVRVFADQFYLSLMMVFHWLIIIAVLMLSEMKLKNLFWKSLGMLFLSLLFLYPLLFHVSHSSVAELKKFIPRTDRISKRFKAVAVVLVPLLFVGMHSFAAIIVSQSLGKSPEQRMQRGSSDIVYEGEDYYLQYYIAITSVYLGSLIFEAVYYSRWCHPIKVTRRKWQEQLSREQNQTAVVHGTINMVTCGDQLYYVVEPNTIANPVAFHPPYNFATTTTRL